MPFSDVADDEPFRPAFQRRESSLLASSSNVDFTVSEIVEDKSVKAEEALS